MHDGPQKSDSGRTHDIGLQNTGLTEGGQRGYDLAMQRACRLRMCSCRQPHALCPLRDVGARHNLAEPWHLGGGWRQECGRQSEALLCSKDMLLRVNHKLYM